ncbi:hypothetical protein C8J57DRAFT_1479966 [Mycena rebaudengoi]|nr:hypothetical protein C8J57DRAFT_1479966 [Mycena rebaudengoi]
MNSSVHLELALNVQRARWLSERDVRQIPELLTYVRIAGPFYCILITRHTGVDAILAPGYPPDFNRSIARRTASPHWQNLLSLAPVVLRRSKSLILKLLHPRRLCPPRVGPLQLAPAAPNKEDRSAIQELRASTARRQSSQAGTVPLSDPAKSHPLNRSTTPPRDFHSLPNSDSDAIPAIPRLTEQILRPAYAEWPSIWCPTRGTLYPAPIPSNMIWKIGSVFRDGAKVTFVSGLFGTQQIHNFTGEHVLHVAIAETVFWLHHRLLEHEGRKTPSPICPKTQFSDHELGLISNTYSAAGGSTIRIGQSVLYGVGLRKQLPPMAISGLDTYLEK